MELTREQKRLLMLHEYKLSEKPNAAETARRINKAWGESTVGESTVRTRFAEFKNGNEDLAHQQACELSTKESLQLLQEQLDDQFLLDDQRLVGEPNLHCHF